MNTVKIINNSGKRHAEFIEEVRKTFNNAGHMNLENNTITIEHSTYSGVYSYTGAVFSKLD